MHKLYYGEMEIPKATWGAVYKLKPEELAIGKEKRQGRQNPEVKRKAFCGWKSGYL